MRILITNTTLLNTGDAAIIEGMAAILREAFGPDIHIACCDAAADAAATHRPQLVVRPMIYDRIARHAAPGVRRKAALAAALAAAVLAGANTRLAAACLPARLRELFADYRAADAVLSAGGTYLVPHYRLTPRIYDFLITLALRRPLVLFTQSLGPFPAGRIRILLRFVFRRARIIMVRDARSQAHVTKLGIPVAKAPICPDAAFALARPCLAPPTEALGERPRIAISVRDWPYFESSSRDLGMARYLDAIAGFAHHVIVAENADVTFVSTCQGSADYWTDDSRTAEEVLARVAEHLKKRITIDTRFRSPVELVDVLRPFHVVVATRMHVAILALCAGVPVVPIAYEFKTRELAERMGLGEVVQDIETVSSSSLIAAWHEIERRRCAIALELFPRVSLARDRAMASGQLVKAALGSGP